MNQLLFLRISSHEEPSYQPHNTQEEQCSKQVPKKSFHSQFHVLCVYVFLGFCHFDSYEEKLSRDRSLEFLVSIQSPRVQCLSQKHYVQFSRQINQTSSTTEAETARPRQHSSPHKSWVFFRGRGNFNLNSEEKHPVVFWDSLFWCPKLFSHVSNVQFFTTRNKKCQAVLLSPQVVGRSNGWTRRWRKSTKVVPAMSSRSYFPMRGNLA